MIDFGKKLGEKQVEKKTRPIDIYSNLDRRSIAGPLRPVQNEILEDWFDNKQNDKDLIIKLHTGEGKTLIGLLILQSKINQGNGPCAFICPNIYLVQQVVSEARKFGIPFCLTDNGLPNEFIEGKKILITHVQKLFNGKSIFGIDNKYTNIGCVILDDSHACIDAIKNSFTIKIKNSHPLYDKILTLFKDDLKEQGTGDFLDICNGDYDALLPIPYWAWIDKKDEVSSMLSDFREDNTLTFVWPLIKNSIEHCYVYITSHTIEITPYHIPIEKFGSFANANQRILMSATTQDDSFFIKGLNFNKNAIQHPLKNTEQKWSGEKMILIPSLIDDALDRDLIVTNFAKPLEKIPFGRVVLAPSLRKANQYEKLGSTVATSNNILELTDNLRKGNYQNTLIIVNRYDGIDLPDEACRILIIDSLPYFDSLVDKYEERCRKHSDIINIRLAQKIEQGLGRSVRGEKDYSVIMLVGADLVKFVNSLKTNKYFSQQTRAQIGIGLKIAEFAKDELKDDEPRLKVILNLVSQSIINRDEGWKGFYQSEMNNTLSEEIKCDIYNILELEQEAESNYMMRNYEKACSIIQTIIDKHTNEDSERGWYMQTMARYEYSMSGVNSNKIQKIAFNLNLQLLKPKDGITYKKIGHINENRIRKIKLWISGYVDYNDLSLAVDAILNDFSFGIDSEKFESAVKEIGSLLGFNSQRPDKEIRKGPDNLWGGIDNMFFLIECKNEVAESREVINKHEAAQMNSHSAWFKSEYGEEAKVKRILIIPTKNLSYAADFDGEVSIMRRGKMNFLKKAIKSFIKEFKPFVINEISDETIQGFINTHKLNINNLKAEYTEAYFHVRNNKEIVEE